ncbi:MAG: biopolymer transporter ExbD [Bacteroidia bacterium]|jgi:biopolymer transport protein ExbD|nr:biopolymer transporter ExbD [Bacteroidia bacterium]
MAEIEGGGGGGHKGGKKRGKKLSTRVDFTPMVDLGFLLITFFMLTTTMNKPQTMEINMPDKKVKTEDEKTKVKASQAITLLLAKDNKVVYYFVDEKTGEPGTPFIEEFGPKDIRRVLLQENRKRNPYVDSIGIYKDMLNKGSITEDQYNGYVSGIKAYKDGLIVVIKAADNAKYENLVDILDEMLICNIGRYAVVDITEPEIDMLKTVNLN